MTNQQTVSKLLVLVDSMTDIYSECSKRALQSKIDALLYTQYGFRHGVMPCDTCRFRNDDCLAIAGG